MKRFITYLACATLVASGGFAYQKAMKAELQGAEQTELRLSKFKSSKSETSAEAVVAERHLTDLAKENAAKKQAAEMARIEIPTGQSPKSLTPKAVAAPWTCSFNSAEDLAANWTLTDGDGNGSWTFSSSYGDGGSAVSWYNSSAQVDDWMVTAQPITLPAGDAYVAFDYGTLSASFYIENFEVLVGTSPNTSEMTSIRQFEGIGVGYSPMSSVVVPFPADAAGDYYVAFHCYSDPDQYGVIIDNVEVNSGTFVGTPDIAVTDVTLPAPSPYLSDSEFAVVTVANQGSCGVASFDLTVSTVCDGNNVTSEVVTISEVIPAGESMEVVLSQAAIDMSAIGVYEVTVTASNITPDGEGNAEANTANNAASSKTTHFGVTDIPFEVDFGYGEAPAQWASDASWGYDDEYYYSMYCVGTTPLYSMGVNLEAGKAYRVNYNYMAGYIFLFWQVVENFEVLCGPAGGDMSVIATHTEEYTNDEFVDGDATFVCSEDGVYQFAFSQSVPGGSLYIASVSITEIGDYDLVIGSISGNPTMLPVAQAASAASNIAVKNRGAQTVTGTITLTAGGETIATAPVPAIAANETVTVPVTYSLESVGAGNTANIDVALAIDGQEDLNPADNSASFSIAITEDELAFDKTTADMYVTDYCIGVGGNLFTVALPIHLTVDDVLTGISVGFGQLSNEAIGLSVYTYDPETGYAGEKILDESQPQGTATGQIRFATSPRALAAGDYLICASMSGFDLVCDMVNPGILYTLVDDGTGGLYVYDQSAAGLGSAAIRAIFGEGTPTAIDLKVNEISAPKNSGIFSANEPITVSVTNNGSEAADGTLTVTVNGEALPAQAVALAPYVTSTYTFYGDLSASGDYTIVATAEIAGEETPEDNSVTKVVTCLEAADPYTMNWEYCADFATDGFNPNWTPYDGDGSATYTFQGISYPAGGEAFAFVAFNPTACEPALASEENPTYYPTSGDRYGASFAAVYGPNDDWLISPLLEMPATGANMTMNVQSLTADYGLERYQVLVSTTDNDPGSFSIVYPTPTAGTSMDVYAEAPVDEWQAVTVDLSAYNGQNIYIALRCISDDAWVFMVDDIVVSKPGSGITDKVADAKLALYPNPATDVVVISATGIQSVAIYSASGAMVGAAKANSSEIRYNVSALAAGVYFAKVNTENGTQVVKFVKK